MRLLRIFTLVLAAFFVGGLIAVPQPAHAGIFVNVTVAPPMLPVYDVPMAPGDGYIWTPGYWAWDGDDYYWVPGAWVLAPEPGLLWTPGYWGFAGGYYGWHAGYWGLHVGYYGGVNYGFGYFGVGFVGGRWDRGRFAYNTAIFHVGPGMRNVYMDRTVIRPGGSRYSFNGPGGINRGPVAAERIAERDHHVGPMGMQAEHERVASQDRSLHFNANHGRPAIGAVERPMTRQNHDQMIHNASPTREAGPAGYNRPNSSGPAVHNAPYNQSQSRPEPQTRQQPQPQSQSRPQPQVQSHPQQQSHPQPQVHTQQQSHPASAPSHPQSREEEHPR